MSDLDQHIERLIVRHLDDQLSEDEQLELNRELIRNPEARRTLEAYQRIDELSGEALEHAFGDEHPAFDPATLATPRVQEKRYRYHGGWWLVPGAIAAALLAVVLARFTATPMPEAPVATGGPQQMLPVRPAEYDELQPGPPMLNAGNGRTSPLGRRINRNTGREIIGVVGNDGNIYWIEVDRTQTIRRPRPGSVVEF